MPKRIKKTERVPPDLFIGVDPGQSGGIAVLWADRKLAAHTLIKMPATESDVFKALQVFGSRLALIEKVHSMPGQGVASMFKFGMGYGGLRMALVGNKIPFDEISPKKWQREFVAVRKKSETSTQWKNRLKAKAQQLFPQEKVTLCTADALLLAEYCRRKYS